MANDPRFEVFKQRHRSTVDEEGFAQMLPDQWGWRFRAANGQVVATAGEGFTREEDAEWAINDAVEAILNVALSGGKMAGARNLPIMAEVLRDLPILRVDG